MVLGEAGHHESRHKLSHRVITGRRRETGQNVENADLAIKSAKKGVQKREPPVFLRNMSFRGENEKSQICRKGRGGGSPTITNNRVSDAENGTVRK